MSLYDLLTGKKKKKDKTGTKKTGSTGNSRKKNGTVYKGRRTQEERSNAVKAAQKKNPINKAGKAITKEIEKTKKTTTADHKKATEKGSRKTQGNRKSGTVYKGRRTQAERSDAVQKAQVEIAKRPVVLATANSWGSLVNDSDKSFSKEAQKEAEKTKETKAYKAAYTVNNALQFLVPGGASKSVSGKVLKGMVKASGKNAGKKTVKTL